MGTGTAKTAFIHIGHHALNGDVMTTKSDIDSPFNWRGKPSIFTQGTFKSKQVFDGANTNRAAMQTRLEPRPTYLISN